MQRNSQPDVGNFRLVSHEVASTSWRKVRGYLQAQLAYLRELNDNNLDDNKTARLRGQITQIKMVLEIAEEEKPKAENESEGF